MKWIKKWTDYGPEQWECEELTAYVSRDSSGSITVSYDGNTAVAPINTPIGEVLKVVQEWCLAGLKLKINELQKGLIPVEDEVIPGEVIPGSQDKLGYGYGWLRTKQG